MSVDTAFEWLFWLVALGVWIWLMEKLKRRPEPLIGDSEIAKSKDWLRRNWSFLVVALGAVLAVWGLTGWQQRGPFNDGGLAGNNRNAVVVGSVLIAVGWLARRSSD
jgi:hypothetical protein